MILKRFSLRVLALSFMAILVMASCKKDELEVDTTLGEDESIEQAAGHTVDGVVDILTVRDNQGQCGTDWQERLPDCAIVTGESDTYPKVLTIDFGNGCEAKHGRILKGKINVSITNDLMVENASRTVTFEDFFVDETQIEGVRVKTNTGLNADGQQTFSTSISTTITKGEKVLTHQHQGTQTWISGYDTPVCDDNVFQLEGAGMTTRSDGLEVTKTITTPLLVDRNCKHILSGVVSVTAIDKSITIDFGEGACDDEATISDGTNTWTIDLGKHKRRGK